VRTSHALPRLRHVIRLAYVTTSDASDITAWSGLPYNIAQSLEAQSMLIDFVGPLSEKSELFFKGKQALYQYVLKRKHLRDREPTILEEYARQVSRKLRPEQDVVFSPGTIPIAYLECEQPIVFWTDATFRAMVDFYPQFSRLSDESIQAGNAAEDSALRRARLAIYSSHWAAESAVTHYGVERKKVAVVPFGSNMPGVSREAANGAIDARPGNRCRLLFIGAEWDRKGGPVAVKVAQTLNEAGLETELDVVGCSPDLEALPSFVKRFGFISKATPEGRATLRRLLMRSHFLVAPSRADCSPVAVCEANAHAVPALATRVGGIATIVRDEVNGKLFARDADPAEYCSYILDLVANPRRYRELAHASFDEYRQRLNWTIAGASVRRLCENVLESR
jgi:glycosyltransferase involved in cell wall biosynthesis